MILCKLDDVDDYHVTDDDNDADDDLDDGDDDHDAGVHNNNANNEYDDDKRNTRSEAG